MNIDIYEQLINAGADDYFTKPFPPKTLLLTIKKGSGKRSLVKKNIQLEKQLKQVEHFLASNHYYQSEEKILSGNLFFNTILLSEITRAKRYNREFSVVLFEITYPSDEHNINFVHKTDISDELLQHILISTRKTDFVLNSNGHYAIILVETPKNGSRMFTKRLMQDITNLPIIKNNLCDQIENNIKINYITYPEQSDSMIQLLGDAADILSNKTLMNKLS
jgi:PleD family two-component response regulator